MDFSNTKMTRKIERSVKIKAGQLIPNPWNPYRNKSDRLQEAIAESIGEFDQIQDIVCRPHPTIPGKYEILDGEGRHRTFDTDADVFVTIVHGLTEAQARKITIVMDETRATADQDLLTGLLAELAEEYSIDDLLTGLPYDDNQLSEMIEMGSGDFAGMGTNPVPTDNEWAVSANRIPEGPKDPFQSMTFTLHDDQSDIVKDALKLAISKGKFHEINQNSNGNALHRICQEYLKC